MKHAIALKPCGICKRKYGNDGLQHVFPPTDGYYAHVTCQACGHGGPNGKTDKEAIGKWNRNRKGIPRLVFSSFYSCIALALFAFSAAAWGQTTYTGVDVEIANALRPIHAQIDGLQKQVDSLKAQTNSTKLARMSDVIPCGEGYFRYTDGPWVKETPCPVPCPHEPPANYVYPEDKHTKGVECWSHQHAPTLAQCPESPWDAQWGMIRDLRKEVEELKDKVAALTLTVIRMHAEQESGRRSISIWDGENYEIPSTDRPDSDEPDGKRGPQ